MKSRHSKSTSELIDLKNTYDDLVKTFEHKISQYSRYITEINAIIKTRENAPAPATPSETPTTLPSLRIILQGLHRKGYRFEGMRNPERIEREVLFGFKGCGIDWDKTEVELSQSETSFWNALMINYEEWLGKQ